MLIDLKDILAIAEGKNCAIPAFNVYNMETVMGVMKAAEALNAPVIFQVYSRLFNSDLGDMVAPVIMKAAKALKTPCAFHLDHGAGDKEVERALRNGATGVMIDASAFDFEKNVAITQDVVRRAAYVGVPVEGELGHVGTTKEESMGTFTDADEAAEFVRRTGVSALAILVGTAHGRYKKAPKLDIERIAAIHAKTGAALVLHGGSGVPDDQIRAAIQAGIRKINFGTDLCYSFLDGVFDVPRDIVAIDLFMAQPIERVKAFAMEKIRLLGAEGAANG